MKLRYFFSILALGAILFTGCDDDDSMSYLDEVRVSSSHVALPIEGGDTTFIIKAVADWAIEVDTAAGVHEWLTVTPAVGTAGETEVTLSAAAYEGRTGTLYIHCAGKTQTVNIIQGKAQVYDATVKEVMEGIDGKTYRVTGTVTKIANTTYGNFYMNDGTSDTDLYIYGTLTPDGQSKQWATLGISEGDIVTVEGPRTLYGSTVELVDATFISLEKSLIKVGAVSPEDATLPLEGGEFTVGLICKGQGVTVDIPEDAKEWLSMSSIASATDTATVVFRAAANIGGDRSTTIVFHTTDGVKDYTAQTTVAQKGAIIKATVAEFNAAPVGDTQYRIKAAITNIKNNQYGNMNVADGTGSTYIYGTNDFANWNLAEGYVVTLVGPRSEYNGPQMKNATVEEVIPVEKKTAVEFNALEDSNDKYYMLTGTIKSIVKPDYGNIYIEDETGEAYIYGVYTHIDGAYKQFESLGLQEGDNITVITIKTSYNDSPQGKNAWFISKNNVAE